jgi:RNA 3'-terminal phosphate cyclase (ATP)
VIEIDGSMGEGGGQLLRSALALSLATGMPFRIARIRARRRKPGLLRQHLTCVEAATRLSQATTEGVELGSQEIRFAPGALRGGQHEFSIGTAGSTLLVAQALLPALLVAPSPSRLVLSGGTHNPGAPPFEFFSQALLPLLARCGATVSARLVRHGFFPAGGGRVEIEVTPARSHQPLDLAERGELQARSAVALRSNLPAFVTHAECETLRRRLGWRSEECVAQEVAAHGPGNVVLVTLKHERSIELIVSFGAKGVPAEQVANAAAVEVEAWLANEHAVGSHLADQLPIPLALLAGGTFTTGALTPHASAVLAVLNRFIPGAATVRATRENGVQVSLCGR